MTTPRFRTERCTHGLAVGLCENRMCKGSERPRTLGRQLVAKANPQRCAGCRHSRVDAAKRGRVYGDGKQRRWCDDCWPNHERRLMSMQGRDATILSKLIS